MSNWKFYTLFICVALFLSSSTFTEYWPYIVLVTILLLTIVYLIKDHKEWTTCEKISSSSNFMSLMSEYKWAGFHSKMEMKDALEWSMKIGLISRCEYLQYKKSLGNFTDCVFMHGTWFRDSVKEIAFRTMSCKLAEIRFTLLPDNSIFKLTAEKQFEEKLAYLNQHVFAWKQFVRIALTCNDEVQITVFLTPKKKNR